MGKTVLITGVSGGIGKELADRFAKGGYDLVLVARSESKLVELSKEYKKKYDTYATVIAKDVTLPGVPEGIFAELKEKGIVVDYLVNNAGFGLYGTFLETNLEQEMNMIDINIKALTIMTKLFLPDMVNRGQGGVMNVASLVSFFPGPMMSIYYATKAYVLSFTEALENELSGTGVTVTALCPGLTSTGFVARSGMGESKMFQSGAIMEAGQVAEEGYRGFIRGDTIIIPGARNRLMAFIPRLLPRKWVTRMVRSTQNRTGH
ncbi:SDR family NAD(P)-dependent oxidoreductase [Paenibacillus sp. Leaf72]|uniref:SDR family NAD(P)-dependent oxidoreductase n=1 Tax=Paenibacillus sp. Leaf72 TaxID=1736234 RepID=UPI0006F60D10|nr:SDR family oxidoreductase [Paenibacillus sp. Leaf72]KQN99876.1 short-chain dehydrogenase [Paenibacillus sp. Leaf72]